MTDHRTAQLRWAASGVAAGLAGLAVGYLVSALMNLRLTPVSAVAELVVALAPDAAANNRDLGTADKPLLVAGIYVVLLLAFAGIGLVARKAWWLPVAGFAAIAAIGIIATLNAADAQVTDVTPVVIGFVAMIASLSLITDRLRTLRGADRQAALLPALRAQPPQLPGDDRRGRRRRGARRHHRQRQGRLAARRRGGQAHPGHRHRERGARSPWP